MAKAPKTISASDKKAQMAGLKTALSNHNGNVKSISAALKEADKTLSAAKKESDTMVKNVEKANAVTRKTADSLLAAAQKAYAAAVAKSEKAAAAAAKGTEKLTAQIAALEAVPVEPLTKIKSVAKKVAKETEAA
jgi:ABC-type transporter Mla subunit MlaD